MTKPFTTSHPGKCNASLNGGCSKCYLFRYRSDARRVWGGDPSLVEPEPGRAGVVQPAAHSGGCRYEGDELTGPERQAAGLEHARQWRYCLNPTKPLGPHVCRCKGCGPACKGYAVEIPDGAMVIEHGAGGIGDAALLLPCVNALKLADPDRPIVLRVSPTAMPFVREFHGYDRLETNPRLHTEQPSPDAIQANTGYGDENRRKYPIPRWERYQRNIGSPGFVIPELRDSAAVLAAGSDHAGSVVLCPGSTDLARQWSLHHWLTLERELLAAGYRVVILDNERSRTGRFRGARVIGETARRVLGVLLNAALVIGSDSGLPHLGGLLRRPTIVLGGGTPVERIFGAYPSAVCIQGQLDCSGCGGGTGAPVDPPFEDRCHKSCSNLQSISPDRVAGEVARLLGGNAIPLPLLPTAPPLRVMVRQCTESLEIKELIGERSLLDGGKLLVIRDEARRTEGLPGDVAELGVFRGGVAKMLGQFAPLVHLFDTFTGIPQDDSTPGGVHKQGEFAADLRDVLNYLDDVRTVCHVGTFPDTTTGLDALRFRFVHVDGDTYQTTLAACAWFAPRMVPGGAMVFDDYEWVNCPGVARAIHETFGAGRVERGVPGQAVVRF